VVSGDALQQHANSGLLGRGKDKPIEKVAAFKRLVGVRQLFLQAKNFV